MNKIETSIEIHTAPEKVWDELVNFELYPEWNPFIKRIEKESENHLQVTIQIPGRKEMTLRPEILKYLVNRELRWKGKLLLKGIFDGEHYFILEKSGINNTHFIHGEIFSGILPPLMKSMLKDTEEGFYQMNLALKKRCESDSEP